MLAIRKAAATKEVRERMISLLDDEVASRVMISMMETWLDVLDSFSEESVDNRVIYREYHTILERRIR